MIITELSNTTPYIINSAMAVKSLGNSSLPTPKTTETREVDCCKFECGYVATVFAKVGGEYWENDMRSFLYRKLTASDTITIKLFKNGTELATISDNTYGTFHSSFTLQPLYVGFILDFEKVANVSGFGRYQIKTDVNIAGVTDTLSSEVFKLIPYSDLQANGTVRIESYQNGNILRSQFDHTGLNWYQSYRIRGRLTREEAFETDNYVTNEYQKSQIQDKIINNWTLETGLIPANISNELVYNNLLANKFLITDYNILNHEIYRRVELYPSEINESVNLVRNSNKKYLINFVDRNDDIIKRNF